MSLTIKRLEAIPELSESAIERFLEENSFPIVEGSTVTFAYLGEADGVNLQHWIYGLTSAKPFVRLKDTNLWYLVFDLPPESRIEYKFEIVRGNDKTWILDPLNSQQAHDPFGSNSVCYGAGYTRPVWTWPEPGARAGEIIEQTLYSRALKGKRSFQVYLPARFRKRRRYPLLFVHDGEDYLHFAQLKTVLDNLIHRLEIAPLIAVLTQSPDRLREYGADPRHARFLSAEILPFMRDTYPLIDTPAARGLMGASFGAVASLHTAFRYPETFGRLLLQSGSFAFSEIGPHRKGPVFDDVVRFVNSYRDRPVRLSERLFLTCGIYEPLIYENRSMLPLFQQTGMEVRYVEARDGHNWENWRDRLRDALSWLFPGPLWMVYE